MGPLLVTWILITCGCSFSSMGLFFPSQSLSLWSCFFPYPHPNHNHPHCPVSGSFLPREEQSPLSCRTEGVSTRNKGALYMSLCGSPGSTSGSHLILNSQRMPGSARVPFPPLVQCGNFFQMLRCQGASHLSLGSHFLQALFEI